MSSRYREDLHSEDLELEKNIRLFCGLDIKRGTRGTQNQIL